MGVQGLDISWNSGPIFHTKEWLLSVARGLLLKSPHSSSIDKPNGPDQKQRGRI